MSLEILNSLNIDAHPSNGKRQMFRDNEVKQLWLRFEPSGSKHWYFRGTNAAGTRAMVKLGSYPIMTVRAARREALQMVEINRGAIPRFLTLQDMVNTFCGDAFVKLGDVRLYRSLGKYPADCDNGAWSFLPDRPQDVRPQDITRYIDRLHSSTELADGTIRNMLGLIRKAYSFYLMRGDVERNPVAEFFTMNKDLRGKNQVLKPTPPRKTYFSDAQIERGLQKPWECADTLDFFKLAFLTGCRLEELRSLKYSEVDLEAGVIRFPGERKKNGRPHELALCAAAQRIVSDRIKFLMVNFHIFPELASQTGQALTERMKKTLGRTPHDIRRTVSRDLSREVKCPGWVISKILSHTPSERGVAQVTMDYTDDETHHDVDEQRIWLEKLSKYYTEKYGF